MDPLFDSRIYRSALIAIFLATSWLPLVGGFVGFGSDVAEIELREPAPLPVLAPSWTSIRELPDQIDAYLDDSFGFRSVLVTAHSLLHLAMGVSGSQRYIVGREGWFFHREVDDVLEQARGTNVFSPDALSAWIDEMESRRRWLAREGIEFLIVIAPSKQVVYPEYLPSWVNVVGPTRYEQLRARLPSTRLPVLDLHAPLRAAKSAGDPLYFRTDGHWNDLGAFIAYREIARWIHERHRDVEVLDLEDFTVTWQETGTGTITRGLNLIDIEVEPIPTLELRGGSRVVSTELLGTGPPFSTTYISRTRTDRAGGFKVLFIRDSFATPLARILGETVYETVTIHHQSGRFDRRAVREYEPDLVIYEMIERGLAWPLQETRPGR